MGDPSRAADLCVGALQFGASCRSLEDAAQAGAVPDAVDRIDAIASGFEDVRTALLDARVRRAQG
jgi:hypothetical protein